MQTWKTLDSRRVEVDGLAFMKGVAQITTCVFLNIVAVLPKVPLKKGKIPFTFRVVVGFTWKKRKKRVLEICECHVCEAKILKTA